MFEAARDKGFQIFALHHAEAILKHDMPEAAEELELVLLGFIFLWRNSSGEVAGKENSLNVCVAYSPKPTGGESTNLR